MFDIIFTDVLPSINLATKQVFSSGLSDKDILVIAQNILEVSKIHPAAVSDVLSNYSDIDVIRIDKAIATL